VLAPLHNNDPAGHAVQDDPDK